MAPRSTLCWLAVVAACGNDKPAPAAPPTAPPDAALFDAAPTRDADPLAGFVPRHTNYPDVASAVKVVLGDRPRVLGIGEIHERTDRAAASVPTLVRFARELLPAIASQTSDLVIETWTLEPGCQTGVADSRKIEATMKRPAATTNHISSLFGITKANSIKAHVMRLTCADLKAATAGGVDPVALLGLVTRELGRISASAVRYRDEHGEARPIIAVYGGALHNDLYPPRSTREWSYALPVDEATGGRFVELDLYRPEQVEGVELYQREPWYPLVAEAGPDHVVLIERAPHAWLLLLPREP